MILLCSGLELLKNIIELFKVIHMKITELIALHITEVFEGNNWTDVNIKDTIDNIDYREATTVTKASYNTIAALLHHLNFYNDVVSMRLMGINPEIDEVNGFNVPAIKNEHDWQQLKDAAFASAINLADAVRKFPEEKIYDLTVTGHSTYYKTLHGLTEHAHYHLGQMMLIKRLVRSAVPHGIMSNSL